MVKSRKSVNEKPSSQDSADDNTYESDESAGGLDTDADSTINHNNTGRPSSAKNAAYSQYDDSEDDDDSIEEEVERAKISVAEPTVKRNAFYNTLLTEYLASVNVASFEDVQNAYLDKEGDQPVSCLMADIILYLMFYRKSHYSHGYSTVYSKDISPIYKAIRRRFPQNTVEYSFDKLKTVLQQSQYYQEVKELAENVTGGMRDSAGARSLMDQDIERLLLVCPPSPMGYRMKVIINSLREIGTRGGTISNNSLEIGTLVSDVDRDIINVMTYDDNKSARGQNLRKILPCNKSLANEIKLFQATCTNVTWVNDNHTLKISTYSSLYKDFANLVERAGYPPHYFSLHSFRKGFVTKWIIKMLIKGHQLQLILLVARQLCYWSDESTLKFYLDHNLIALVMFHIKKANREGRQFRLEDLTVIQLHPDLNEEGVCRLMEPCRYFYEFSNQSLDGRAFETVCKMYDSCLDKISKTCTEFYKDSRSAQELIEVLQKDNTKHQITTKIVDEVVYWMNKLELLPRGWEEATEDLNRRTSGRVILLYLLVNDVICGETIEVEGIQAVQQVVVPSYIRTYFKINPPEKDERNQRTVLRQQICMNDCRSFRLNRLFTKKRQQPRTDHFIIIFGHKVLLKNLTKKQCRYLDAKQTTEHRGLYFIHNDSDSLKEFSLLGNIDIPTQPSNTDAINVENGLISSGLELFDLTQETAESLMDNVTTRMLNDTPLFANTDSTNSQQEFNSVQYGPSADEMSNTNSAPMSENERGNESSGDEFCTNASNGKKDSDGGRGNDSDYDWHSTNDTNITGMGDSIYNSAIEFVDGDKWDYEHHGNYKYGATTMVTAHETISPSLTETPRKRKAHCMSRSDSACSIVWVG